MALDRATLDTPSAHDRLPSTIDLDKTKAARAAALAWERVKAAIAKRDSYCCRMCGRACRYGDPIETRADAHHIILASQGGPDQSWNLIHLCRRCHDLCHKVKRFWLSGNADDRDPAGKGCVKVERQGEAGFEVVGLI